MAKPGKTSARMHVRFWVNMFVCRVIIFRIDWNYAEKYSCAALGWRNSTGKDRKTSSKPFQVPDQPLLYLLSGS